MNEVPKAKPGPKPEGGELPSSEDGISKDELGFSEKPNFEGVIAVAEGYGITKMQAMMYCAIAKLPKHTSSFFARRFFCNPRGTPHP